MKNSDKQLWCVYNHMPGGQMVATHFERTTLRKMLGGDKTQEIIFTPAEQLENFKKSDFVALNVKGIITKHAVLVYMEDNDLTDEPRAADIVLAWATTKGVEPIRTIEERQQQVTPKEQVKRVEVLEERVNGIDAKIDRILEAVGTGAKK